MNDSRQNNKVRFQPYPIKFNAINANNVKTNTGACNKQNVLKTINNQMENQLILTSILKKTKQNANQATNSVNNTLRKSSSNHSLSSLNNKKFQFNKNPHPQQQQQQQQTFPKVFQFQQNSNNTKPAIAKSDVISNLVFQAPTMQHQPNNYDLRGYKETNQLMINKFNNNQFITQSTTTQPQEKTPTKSNNSNPQLKVLTTTIEKLKTYQEMLQKKHSVLFETIAQLDSVITDYPNSARQFFIKDTTNNENLINNRMQCVFYEIDRKLQNLVRGSFIRCVGQYNTKKKLFVCYSVRSATHSELLSFTNYVDLTDQSIIDNF